MSKKVPAGKQKVSYREIIADYEKGNYPQAAILLRKTKFPPQEKEKIDQLNINIHFFWALDYFNNKNYPQAIATLRMFVERYKKRINLPLAKANILLGLSYLYLNNWEKAGSYLQSTKNEEATQPFYFYYLLTLIYQKKYPNLFALSTEHAEQIKLLQADRKQYFAFAFSLVSENFEKAQTLLADYPSIDEYHAVNIEGLKAILSAYPYERENKELKSLYKALLKIKLTREEEQYLATIPQFEESLKGLKNDQLKSSLKNSLQKLCEEGQALKPSEFTKCMAMPEAYRPYIVYNQIAALFNDDIEENEPEILEILKKYEWHFFQIPEALFLFTQIVYWDSDNFTSTSFWRSIEIGLDRFGKSLSPLQLNRLSWRIYSCLQYSDYMGQKTDNRRLSKFAIAYPQMLGLKLWQVMDYVMMPDMAFPQSALDLFTFANFQYGSEIAKDNLNSALNIMSSFTGMVESYGFMFDHDFAKIELKKKFQSTLQNLQTVLIEATTKYEVHLKNRVVLDLFKITCSCMIRYKKEENITFDQHLEQAFASAYHGVLVLFEEDKPDAEYFQNYQLLVP